MMINYIDHIAQAVEFRVHKDTVGGTEIVEVEAGFELKLISTISMLELIKGNMSAKKLIERTKNQILRKFWSYLYGEIYDDLHRMMYVILSDTPQAVKSDEIQNLINLVEKKYVEIVEDDEFDLDKLGWKG